MDLDHGDRLRVAAARAQFLGGGPAGVRDLVAASWRRSRSAGVDADEYRIRHHDDVDLDSRLVRCARPVIERLADEMVDVPVAIALSDAQARIVHRLDCSTAVGRPLDRVDFTAGFSFAEGGVGTNGIGTVFEAGTSVSVVGAEHFTEALVRFACTGAPILNPVTGRVEGVLDVSSLAEDWTPLMQSLVRRAAADIGHNLLLDRGQSLQALFETFARADARPRQAVMAVGESVMVNRRAQQLFSPAEQSAIQQHALYLMGRRDRVRESLVLDSGRRVRLRAKRILAGEEVAGIVLLLDEDPGRLGPGIPVQRGAAAPAVAGAGLPAPPGATARRRPGPVGVSRSPAWTGAGAQIAAALDRGDALLVMGEPGTGRRTLVVELFRELHPAGRAVTGDADRLLREAGALPCAVDGPALVVLEHLDRLDVDGVGAVHRWLASDTRGGCLVAATVDESSLGEDRPFRGLLGAFDQSVTLPPLRFRAADLPAVVARLLGELAPGRRVRVHPDALRLLGRHPWPGNLTQLREALEEALSRRPVGDIRPGDLPGHCQTAGTRTLTPIEVAERDAIVAALRDCGGNRMHAAASLGMARSSLYRKIRTYGVGDT
ncbi:sigma-54-dependent Fis family transcriptional regulator [Geodermatophilus sp. SYSU D00697]